MQDLQDHVTELEEAIPHLYGSWSRELLYCGQGERHIAIYPTGDPEVSKPFITGTPPADEITSRFTILVWEDAAAESSRAFDDDDSNKAWLALYESIKARLYVQANTGLGVPQGYTRYAGGLFDLQATARMMQLSFTVLAPQSFT